MLVDMQHKIRQTTSLGGRVANYRYLKNYKTKLKCGLAKRPRELRERQLMQCELDLRALHTGLSRVSAAKLKCFTAVIDETKLFKQRKILFKVSPLIELDWLANFSYIGHNEIPCRQTNVVKAMFSRENNTVPQWTATHW